MNEYEPCDDDLQRLSDDLNSGRYIEAEVLAQSMITDFPNYQFGWKVLGVVFSKTDRYLEALRAYLKAVQLEPGDMQAYYNLGTIFENLNRLDDAKDSYSEAIKLKSDYAQAYFSLGNVLRDLCRFEEAKVRYKQAISLKFDFVAVHNNLGNLLLRLGKLDEAEISFRKTILFNPNFTSGYRNLGNVLRDRGQFEEALECYKLAIALNSNLEYLFGNATLLKQQLGDWDQLPDDLEELVSRIDGGEKAIPPFALQALMDTPEVQKKCSVIYADHQYPKSTVLPEIEPYRDHEKIRIGYFSCDFCTHPVTTGIADLFKLHDRSKFEIHAFGFGVDIKDQWNIRVREDVDFYHDAHKVSDKDIALLSRSLEIDIAVDLSGYTKGNRTGIFAMSVAPIQLHYIGFLGTMGTNYYDYIISDRVMIPEANKDYYTENIVYLPSYQVNSRQPHSPDTSLDRQYFGIPEDVFVFCCFNNALKITPDVFDSWARILSEVKDSVLMLYVGNDVAIKNYQKQISARGIDSSRLIFTGQLSGSSYWSRYQAVDLFLDTFYYSGGMTSSDALRVGCPVLTWMGDSFSSRFGASILTSLGLSELITSKQSEYEALAIRLAKNPKEFEVLRDKLAANLSIKPLYNTQQFADSIEAAYQEMHDQNQSGEKPTDIYIDQREKQYE